MFIELLFDFIDYLRPLIPKEYYDEFQSQYQQLYCLSFLHATKIKIKNDFMTAAEPHRRAIEECDFDALETDFELFHVIKESWSTLSEEQRATIFTYLQSLLIANVY